MAALAQGRPPSWLAYLTLLTSFSTLVCCALPALLVALGAGAALAGVIAEVPQLVWFSTYKLPLFIGAGVLLALSGVLQWRGRHAPCPADPALAAACTRLRRRSHWVYRIALAIFAVGIGFAYIVPLFL